MRTKQLVLFRSRHLRGARGEGRRSKGEGLKAKGKGEGRKCSNKFGILLTYSLTKVKATGVDYVPLTLRSKILTLGKLQINLHFLSLIRTFELAFEGTHVRENSNIIWFSSHLIVPLSPK